MISTTVHSEYILIINSAFAIITLYVDDLLILSNDKDFFLNKIKRHLSGAMFQMIDVFEVIGLQTTRVCATRTIYVSHEMLHPNDFGKVFND